MHSNPVSPAMSTPYPHENDPAQMQMQSALERQAKINTDPEFNAQFHKLMRLFPHIPESRLRMFVGMPNDEGGINDTPLKCLRAALPAHMEIPAEVLRKMGEGPEAAKNSERVVKDAAFKAAWAEYVVRCQERKQRIEQAQRVYEVEVAEAKGRLAAAKAEPVPEAPKR